MKTFKELTEAWLSNKTLIWNDPDPIEGNDYTITFMDEMIEKADDLENDELMPILIQYNGGMSEAEVFLHELMIIKQIDMKLSTFTIEDRNQFVVGNEYYTFYMETTNKGNALRNVVPVFKTHLVFIMLQNTEHFLCLIKIDGYRDNMLNQFQSGKLKNWKENVMEDTWIIEEENIYRMKSKY